MIVFLFWCGPPRLPLQQAEQNFRRLLILKVQKKFEKEEDPVPENLEGDELEELLYRRRKLRLGSFVLCTPGPFFSVCNMAPHGVLTKHVSLAAVMTFIGELFKAGMLNDRIMHSVIRELLRIPAAQSSAAENELYCIFLHLPCAIPNSLTSFPLAMCYSEFPDRMVVSTNRTTLSS